MSPSSNPYDDYPYRSYPIEWTAPERLALASLLHGGPRMRVDARYRVLEIGCGNGANLLPMAYYRQNGTFVGLDGAGSQIALARARAIALGLSNAQFIHCDLRVAAEEITGRFDYIVAHGVFSWLSVDLQDLLLRFVASRLRDGGLFYLNYNAKPGWNVRGIVREFLMAQTAGELDLRRRAEVARLIAKNAALALSSTQDCYSVLMANEFRFVCEGDLAWVAHEFLANENHAYWRSEFLALARHQGLTHVADADFSYSTGRPARDLGQTLVDNIALQSTEDAADLLCRRQLHSPVLTTTPLAPRLPDVKEFGAMFIASCMDECGTDTTRWTFKHPSGYEVDVTQAGMCAALRELRPLWPRALSIVSTFSNVEGVMDDLMILHRNGLVELRCVEPDDHDGDELNECERAWGGYFTTPYHEVRSAELAET
jgi:SAM-dependent methyltransferase